MFPLKENSQQQTSDPVVPEHHNYCGEDTVAKQVAVEIACKSDNVESQQDPNEVQNNDTMSLQSARLSLLSCEQHHGDLSPLSPTRNENGSVASGGSSASLNSSSSSSGNHDVPHADAAATAAGCPYAVALQLNSYSTSKTLAPSLPGLIELKDCPAFANQGCPFKGAKSPDEISQKLAQIPPSHLDSEGVFMKTLAFYHKETAMSPTANVNGTSGGCPVKALLPKDFSFDRALEEYSLAAIMSKLAKEHELLLPKPVDWNDQTADEASVCSSNAIADMGDDHALDELSEVQSIEDFEEAETAVERSVPPSKLMEAQQEQPEPYHSIPLSSGGQRRLSDALKSGTAQAHEAAESVHFVKNFIRGIIDRELYGLLVAQLFHVYQRLEGALEQHAPTHFAPCHFPAELNRSDALQEDVDFWHTTSSPPVSSATQDYLDRIDHLAKEDPLLLLAHAYTRYLGDLSGGKILARVAKRALQLEKTDEGLAFYHFDKIPSAKKFKDQYRTSLNELPLSDGQVQALVQEANVAFLLNMRLFEELDVLGGVPNAHVRKLDDVYRVAKEAASTRTAGEPQQAAAACPFANVGGTTAAAVGVHTKTKHTGGGTCPWPFILLHDPKAGMKRWQTWLTIGLFIALCYQQIMTETVKNAVSVGNIQPMHLLTETVNSASSGRPAIVQTHTQSKQKKNDSSAKPFRRAVSYSQIYQVWKDDSDSLKN